MNFCALAKLIEHGITGFFVWSVKEMADATARARFSEARMIRRDVGVFHPLASGAATS